MSNDVADGTQAEQSTVLTLSDLGLIGAVASAMEDHQKNVIQPKKDAPKELLLQGFIESKQSDLVVEIDGEEVGTYKVATTNPKFVVDDEKAFDRYAEEKGEVDIVIVRKASFEKAVLGAARRDPETGAIFDSRTGEIIPGLKYLPGGKPTGTVRWTWKTFKGEQVGKAVLMAAIKRGDLNHILRETPELLPGAGKPAAENG
ncbi:hypothetical protein ABZ468_07805 [Streptomyces sp. NPDC005708]|uniref:hypothetical protein n=1 Tax=Streptomyces sp. NPDC005708 TaxID=3154564 RepID=UPI0033C24E15